MEREGRDTDPPTWYILLLVIFGSIRLTQLIERSVSLCVVTYLGDSTRVSNFSVHKKKKTEAFSQSPTNRVNSYLLMVRTIHTRANQFCSG